MPKFTADFYRLKAAMADLVTRCGGQKRSGELIGLAQSTMSYVCQREHSAVLSGSAKLALERECGEPVVTRVEAEILGFRLEREGPAPAAEGCIHGAHAAVMIEVADFCRAFGEAWRDRDYSRTDAVLVDHELSDLVRKIEAFRRINAAEMAKRAGRE